MDDDQAARRRTIREQVVEREQSAGGRIDPAVARVRDGLSAPIESPPVEDGDPDEAGYRRPPRRGR